jgi:hypothetical protein
MELLKKGKSTPLALHVQKYEQGISGLTPTLEIRDTSTGRYFDFNSDGTTPYWINSGGLREKPLQEVSWLQGMYQYIWDTELLNLQDDSVYAIIFKCTDVNYPINRVEFLRVTFEWSADCKVSKKILTNNSTVTRVSTTEALHEWFDNDGVTSLLKHRIEVVGNQEKREKD